MWLNYNEIQHPGSIDLVGTSVSHALTIHSSSTSPSELRFLTGFDKDEMVGFRLDENGEYEMYRAGEEDDNNKLNAKKDQKVRTKERRGTRNQIIRGVMTF